MSQPLNNTKSSWSNTPMYTLFKISGLLLVAALLTGCMSHPSRIEQQSNNLILDFKEPQRDPLLLIGRHRQIVARGVPQGNTVVFPISNHVSMDQCFLVVNKRYRPVFGSNGTPFTLPSMNIYRQLVELEQLSSSTSEKIKKNPAFNGKTCVLPARRALPKKPDIACGTRSKCESEGKALCYAALGLSEGCSALAGLVETPGVISGPGCSFIAARYLKQHYGLGDLAADVVQGYVDDRAGEMEEEGNSFPATILKGLNTGVRIARANQCATAFMERAYSPIDQWRKTVASIKNEPEEYRRQCTSSINLVNEYNGRISSLLKDKRRKKVFQFCRRK